MFDAFISQARARGPCLPHRQIEHPAADGTCLVAGLFQPDGPAQTVYVIVHGAGANMSVGYLDLAKDLHTATRAAVLVPDTRGHGLSGGPRGWCADRAVLWADLDVWLGYSAATFPGASVVLVGHSAGATMILNRLTVYEMPMPAKIAGFAAIAPYFTAPSRLTAGGAGKDRDKAKLAARLSSAFKPNAKAGFAMRFEYPPEAVAAFGMLDGYSIEMAAAQTPREIDGQLGALPVPTRVFAAQDDELFDTEALLHFIRASASNVTARTINGGHMTCLFNAAPAIAAQGWSDPERRAS